MSDTLEQITAKVLGAHADYSQQWDASLMNLSLRCRCWHAVTGREDHTAHQAAMILAAQREAGYVVVQLPEPDEYPIEGEKQWNIYPFVRTNGDEIELGAKCEHIYTINPTEARGTAAALLAAAEAAEGAQR